LVVTISASPQLVLGSVFDVVMGIAWSHGIPEALLGVAVVTPVALAVIKKFK